MEKTITEEKIKKILQIVSQNSGKIKNFAALNSFLKKLDETDHEDLCNILELSIICEWLVNTISLWETTLDQPSEPVIVFTLSLTAFLSKKEELFIFLNGKNVYIRMINLFQLHTNGCIDARIKLISLLKNFLLHRSGIEFIVYTRLWENVLNLSLTSECNVAFPSCEFMAMFIENISKYDEKLCVEVLTKIVNPLHVAYTTNSSVKENDFRMIETVLYENLKPTLFLLVTVLKYLLESPKLPCNLQIAIILNESFHLESYTNYLMEKAQHKDFIFDLSKISFLIQFFHLCIKAKNSLYNVEIGLITKNIMDIYKLNILKNNVDKILKFCHFGLMFWRKMIKRMPELVTNDGNKETLIEDELVTLQLFPVFLANYKFMKCTEFENQLIVDDLRGIYVNKICKSLSEPTIRLAFMWRNMIADHDNSFLYATKALSYIIESKKDYDRCHAIVIFQGVIYTLKDITRILLEKILLFEIYVREKDFLILLLDCLSQFIEEFNITWRESVESICVVSTTIEFLTIPNWNYQVVVKALKLMNISIAKYMAPSLALLVDRTSDSNMSHIGPLIHAKLHDQSWEVRDSALEVLCTISNLSKTKFSSFQKVVLDNDLPQVVIKMSTADTEHFVRATALKCLSELIKVDTFWEALTKTHKVMHQLIYILRNETEGMVRKEAAALICSIYEHHRLQTDQLALTYDTMKFASKDLHWEVKIEVLKFWDLVIKNHLQNQGMIDGAFPTVTFSKENRKIVALTENEIRRRLQKVLSQLSSVGCLGVLIDSIEDNCDAEVSKLAINITQTFAKLLRKYNITPENVDSQMGSISPQVFPSDITLNNESKMSTGFSYQVIDAQNTGLLNNIYDTTGECLKNASSGMYQKIISPQEFLQHASQDYNIVVEEKEKWLKGFDELDSLLDDILKNYEQDVTSMDCY